MNDGPGRDEIAGNQQAYPDEPGTSVYVRPQYVPVVIIKSPRERAKLAGTVSLKGTAFQPDDRRHLVRMQVRVDDGNWATADRTLEWNFRLDTTLLSEGAHKLQVQAFDSERYSIEAERNFTVANAESGVAVPLPLVVAVIVVVVAAAAGGAYMRSKEARGVRAQTPTHIVPAIFLMALTAERAAR